MDHCGPDPRQTTMHIVWVVGSPFDGRGVAYKRFLIRSGGSSLRSASVEPGETPQDAMLRGSSTVFFQTSIIVRPGTGTAQPCSRPVPMQDPCPCWGEFGRGLVKPKHMTFVWILPMYHAVHLDGDGHGASSSAEEGRAVQDHADEIAAVIHRFHRYMYCLSLSPLQLSGSTAKLANSSLLSRSFETAAPVAQSLSFSFRNITQ